jgi:hypothetical protein
MLSKNCYIIDTILKTNMKSVFIPCNKSYNIPSCMNGQYGFVIPCDNDIIYDTHNCPNIILNDVCNFRTCDNNLQKCEYYKCYNNSITDGMIDMYIPTLTTPSISYSVKYEINILTICMLFLLFFSTK